MVDVDSFTTSQELFFYSDASANPELGFGAVFDKKWMFGQWEPGFIETCRPSIEYLELFTLTTAVITWGMEDQMQNCRIQIFCDNNAVIAMVSRMTSLCPNCMFLIRLLVLNGLIANRRVFAKYVWSCDNGLSGQFVQIGL